MYLAYLDDSGTTGKKLDDPDSSFQVVTAVLAKDEQFNSIEILLSKISDLLPEDCRSSFREFKACDLFRGKGIFKKVDQAKRYQVLSHLCQSVQGIHLPVFYGAVDKPKLKATPFASAHPLDIGFHCCALGIQEWMRQNTKPHEVAVIVADDTTDIENKEALKGAFRRLRPKIHPPDFLPGGLTQIHDDMYFGDSHDSVGIQMADVCGFFISRHLNQKAEAEGFYQLFSEQIVCGKVEPS
jgi:hypothetical protein